MVRTSSRKAAWWMCTRPTPPLVAAAAVRAGDRKHEPVAAVYPAARGDIFAHGRHSAGRIRRLPATACLRTAGSRLPDNPGAHLLSGRESGSDGVLGDRSARAPVRSGAWIEAND